ncbi:hypothetical protein CSKR_108745 [Clonorchis sinensis]|uniref:Uncharacterized protein n=1 Tax=Clonorchis sinensis TaxID=79923 RepID=A0A3R7JPZ6_CLOSI|nr:hypothetical protein CSKR_108745 [Clonorchis sinensis]
MSEMVAAGELLKCRYEELAIFRWTRWATGGYDEEIIGPAQRYLNPHCIAKRCGSVIREYDWDGHARICLSFVFVWTLESPAISVANWMHGEFPCSTLSCLWLWPFGSWVTTVLTIEEATFDGGELEIGSFTFLGVVLSSISISVPVFYLSVGFAACPSTSDSDQLRSCAAFTQQTLKKIFSPEGVPTEVVIDSACGSDKVLMQYRNAVHSVTEKSPAILYKSRSLRAIID